MSLALILINKDLPHLLLFADKNQYSHLIYQELYLTENGFQELC